MKTIHENLPLPDPNLCRRNKKKKEEKKKNQKKKKSDESIRHRVLRTGCLTISCRDFMLYKLHINIQPGRQNMVKMENKENWHTLQNQLAHTVHAIGQILSGM